MKRDDKAALLGFLLVVLGLLLLTTAWWRAGIATLAAGTALAGAEKLLEMLRGGFSEAMGWTDEDEDV